MSSRYDYAPIGAVGASDASAAAVEPTLPGLRLGRARPHPITIPARVYVCGITPYDVTHLGHAATFVWADALTRVLRMIDVPSLTVRNVTDVDDVLTAAAHRVDRDYAAFGLMQEHHFESDMKALNVRAPDHQPRARHHIDHVVRLASTLIDQDMAYERAGHVYFRGAAVPQASSVSADEARALMLEYGDEPDDPHRDHPYDVPLWKPSDSDHPAWPSPWGAGRPGWHAECAAMALATLGGAIDVVVGGEDLHFPHHAFQSAIAEAATGGRFTRAEMHVGAVHHHGAKMSKSLGNLVLVSELLDEVSAPALRLLLLDRPWATSWTFDRGHLTASAERLEQLYRAAGTPPGSTTATAAVRSTLLDDLDVPTALNLAIEEGGDAARLLVRVLALD